MTANRERDVERIEIDGARFLTFETVAEIYSIDVHFVESVVDFGLVGREARHGDRRVIACAMLGRVAKIVRLHFYQGVNLEGIGLLLTTE